MKIEFGVNPNCSEAVLRIRTDNLSSEEESELWQLLQKISEYNEETGKEPVEWWGETNVYKQTLFDIPQIVIDGNAPHNSNNELKEKLQKLKFYKKLKMQEEEK